MHGDRFIADRRGAVAIEFAIVAALSIELLLELLQVGFYFYASAGVERAMLKASRAIATGRVNGQSLTAGQFMSQVLCPNITAAGLSCANVVSNIQTVSEGTNPNGFYSLLNASRTGLQQPPLDNTKTSYCPGVSQSYVYVQILYALPVFSPVWRAFAGSFNGSPSYILQATSTFRNEPFQSIATSC